MCSITHFSNKEKEQNAIKAPENTAIFGHYLEITGFGSVFPGTAAEGFPEHPVKGS